MYHERNEGWKSSRISQWSETQVPEEWVPENTASYSAVGGSYTQPRLLLHQSWESPVPQRRSNLPTIKELTNGRHRNDLITSLPKRNKTENKPYQPYDWLQHFKHQSEITLFEELTLHSAKWRHWWSEGHAYHLYLTEDQGKLELLWQYLKDQTV